MRKLISKICGIGAVMAPVITTVMMIMSEPEIEEAIAGGIFFGCIIGSIFGVVSLICNKERIRWLIALSLLPIAPGLFFFFFSIPFLLYR